MRPLQFGGSVAKCGMLVALLKTPGVGPTRSSVLQHLSRCAARVVALMPYTACRIDLGLRSAAQKRPGNHARSASGGAVSDLTKQLVDVDQLAHERAASVLERLALAAYEPLVPHFVSQFSRSPVAISLRPSAIRVRDQIPRLERHPGQKNTGLDRDAGILVCLRVLSQPGIADIASTDVGTRTPGLSREICAACAASDGHEHEGQKSDSHYGPR